MDESTLKSSLDVKLVEIRKALPYFQKTLNKADAQYKYVLGSKLLSVIRGKMDELNVTLHPELSSNYQICEGPNGATRVIHGLMVWVWTDVDSGQSKSIPWLLMGEHEDDYAKAFGCALTYTERYFILKFFNVPTDEDDPDKWQKNNNSFPKPEQEPETKEKDSDEQTEFRNSWFKWIDNEFNKKDSCQAKLDSKFLDSMKKTIADRTNDEIVRNYFNDAVTKLEQEWELNDHYQKALDKDLSEALSD